jgi:hypothetical protein
METLGDKSGGETTDRINVNKVSQNLNLMTFRCFFRCCWLCGLSLLRLAGWQTCPVKEVLNWMRSCTQDGIS